MGGAWEKNIYKGEENERGKNLDGKEREDQSVEGCGFSQHGGGGGVKKVADDGQPRCRRTALKWEGDTARASPREGKDERARRRSRKDAGQ